MKRLAIVNRGEPAMRALDAVAERNRDGVHPAITAIVLYTQPDADAWFVRQADEAINLGPALWVDPADGARKSAYLDEEHVVEELLRANVDAVWVGWGFVAEHASFAERCEQAGITFVGPDSATIRLLGDKIAAKRLAEKADVPVVPWSNDAIEDPAEAAAWAERLGYPVILKASAGGGGRGIRVVRRPEDLADALKAARNEAALGFGDPSVFMEQFVPRARHVEVQIISDGCGGTWAVGIRDCSIQRRNQKVIEESASTVLTPEDEDAIKAAAVRLADAAGYRNAGTVEFLVDPETRDFRFMEVNTRLQVEHPVTEETAGVDLVKLQLNIAEGGRLHGDAPPVRGHAVEARLCAEDPENGFAPSPGRIVLWRPPSGPGIRVDSGVTEGDDIAPEFDSLIAKVIAYGKDRSEAIARLRRGLARAAVVVEGGTTNRSFLLQLLDHPDVRGGAIDNHWLDRLTADGALVSAAEPFAVVMAAIEAYDADAAAVREAFHAGARRGRPELADAAGHEVRLRYRGRAYRLTVFQTGPDQYHVQADAHTVVVTVSRVNEYERRAVTAGRSYRVVVTSERSSFLVDVDGMAHRVQRDDGGIVRAGSPAFIISVLVEPGATVAAGDPLVVLESMKMETLVTAPFGGQIADVLVAAKTQVDPAAPLLRIREDQVAEEAIGAAVDFGALSAERMPRDPLGLLYHYLLGFDLERASVKRAVAELDAEASDRLLDLFADVAALYRTSPEQGNELAEREHVLAFLQWLDPDRAGLTDDVRAELLRVLNRYGVDSLARTPALEEAVVWMWRSFRRADELAPVIAGVLERRLRGIAPGAHENRTLLNRLAEATQTRYADVAGLARDLLFRCVDEPLLEQAVGTVYQQAENDLAALADDPARADRAERVQRLVWCPQPMRPVLLGRWAAASPGFREVLLEVHLRRFYRIRNLHDVVFEERQGHQLSAADYEVDGRGAHLIALYADEADLAGACAAITEHLAAADPERLVVLDLVTWCSERTSADACSARLKEFLDGVDFGRPIHRLDIAVTSEGDEPEYTRTSRFTFRQRDGAFVEELLYRNLHPMIAKRMDLWRLSNFALERLRSVEDVYLFRATAHDNPNDVRLFALAEVRDLTPVLDESGQIVALPLLERMGLQALAAMREAIAASPRKARPQSNRIIIYVRPPFTLPRERWSLLAARYAPLAAAADLQKLVLRVQLPEGDGLTDAVVEFSEDGRIRVRAPKDTPIRPLTPYRQKVLRARRQRAPYPYEIVRMLTPQDGVASPFPRGRFVEYDLDENNVLVPVDRPYGENRANLVVGLVTNELPGVPELTRVAVLGDPTRQLGNLAEPECRRIVAGIDLAEERGLPVEWFAVSSGARIAMDSGVENMDWIGAVLRRLVTFTQGGGEVNIIVTGINVGAQPYWNAEATMLMHTRGILIMTPDSAMVLTGKQALDYSGGVSAEDNFGIGGFEHVMGPNGQGQYWAPDLAAACQVLLRHYEHTYRLPGEKFPPRRATADPYGRDVRTAPHAPIPGSDFATVGDVFSAEKNGERKKPFDIRSVMRAVTDQDAKPLERWARWRSAEMAVVWDARIGGYPVCLIGLESRTLARRGYLPADGPATWTSGTLFPQSSRKVARAINAASGNRPLVVLANLSGFDGSPESMRRWQLEYGAEIGRAVTNFRGPIVFVVISRYHGGAFVVFSKRLNDNMEIAAVEGSYASVIGGAPAAGVVFVREVDKRTDADPRVAALRERLGEGDGVRAELAEVRAAVRAERLGEVAAEFDSIHDIHRAQRVGAVDRIIAARDLRPYVIDAIERGMART